MTLGIALQALPWVLVVIGAIGVPVVQALPKPRRKRRCRTCGYLIAAPGHKRQCGGA